MIRRLIGVGLIMISVGCSSAKDRDTALSETVKAFVSQFKTPAPVDPRQVLTRAAIDAANIPLLLTEIPKIQSAGTLALLPGQRQQPDTWFGADGASFTLHKGVVVATRGLPFDLMFADSVPTIEGLEKGGGRYDRTYKYLTGDNRDQIVTYQCRLQFQSVETVTIFEIRIETKRFSETCFNPDQSFTNIYWVDHAKVVHKSQQFLNFSLGYALTEKLL